MKFFLILIMLAASTVEAREADVGVSIGIGQPGFYGRLEIGNYPPPQLIYSQPIVVDPLPVLRPPIYLRVPPGHERHWRKHCHEYQACGDRVYFVQEGWYNREYVPRYLERHGNRRDERGEEHEYREGRGEGRGEGRER